MNSLVIRGARQHNLKGLDLDIPRDKLVVITGVSGSGKSSLAFDTIYAEGQRRYIESLSAYARQFLQQNQKPDVDHIDGLSPAIAIEQKSSGSNPRSTVGTLTEIYDYLRLLYARVGVPYCYSCGKRVSAQTVQQICDAALALEPGSRVLVLAPLARGRKGELKKELQALAKEGFARVIIDGTQYELSDLPALSKQSPHDVDLVVDRLVVKPEIKQRLTEAVELALKRGGSLVKIAKAGAGEVRLFSERLACPDCGISYPPLEPRLFSFNTPFGACPECHGLGRAMEFDPSRVVPDATKSIEQGALAPMQAPTGMGGNWFRAQLIGVTGAFGATLDTPWQELPAACRRALLDGSGERDFEYRYESDRHQVSLRRPFPGVLPELVRRLKESTSEHVREVLSQFMTPHACQACNGSRLTREARHVRVGDLSIDALCALPVGEISAALSRVERSARERTIATPILREVEARLAFLGDVGLGYLSLDRASGTLAGGEAQRIRLATQIGSALRGVIYVLDEPSIGLHARDNARLLKTLVGLRDLGNTVLIVEHDEATMRAADQVIDMGPAAGVHGGQVVAQGTVEEIIACPESLTGAFLSGRRAIQVPQRRRSGRGEEIVVRGARGNNLKGIDVSFPLGELVCVTGVSGSGKSTLVIDTLFAAAAQKLGGAGEPVAHDRIEGLEHIDRVIEIDQSPIGRSPRSNPATYTGLFGLLRELYAELPESRARGYGPGRYSFNVKGGRCEACEGDGLVRIEMHFLPDVFVTCEQCSGKRYNRETLEVHYKGKSIADLLAMTVDEALALLSAIPQVRRKLETLQEVGLGYVKLGQSATTLSGGEAQRMKLSRELAKRSTGRTLYVLDEPTTGLHFQDIDKLLGVLHSLVDAGNTVLVIEHNLDVIKTADHVIDLGPEGGGRGGEVIAAGTPEQVAGVARSYTGQYLRPLLEHVAASA